RQLDRRNIHSASYAAIETFSLLCLDDRSDVASERFCFEMTTIAGVFPPGLHRPARQRLWRRALLPRLESSSRFPSNEAVRAARCARARLAAAWDTRAKDRAEKHKGPSVSNDEPHCASPCRGPKESELEKNRAHCRRSPKRFSRYWDP